MSERMNASSSETVSGLLDRVVNEHADRTALVFGSERVTYEELGVRVERLARALIHAGVSPGDRVAVRLSNCLEWVDILFAVARIRAVLVPINPSLSDSEVRDLLSRSGTTILFSGTDERLQETTRGLALDAPPSLAHVVAVGDTAIADVKSFDDFLTTRQTSKTERSGVASSDDLMFLIYTSGTTGKPKGVTHTHSVLQNMRDAADRLQFSATDCVVLYLPLCHVYALFVGILALLSVGAKVVLMPRFSAVGSLDLIEKERATVMFGVQTMYYDQISQLKHSVRDLSSVRLCLASGPPHHVRNVREHIGPAINLYGMTECSAITAVASPSDPPELSADTVGLPLPGFEVRVRDERGTVSTVGRGQCEVRGAAVTKGYFEDPEATSAAFAADGWFKTGDDIELMLDGRVRYLGRVRDSYKTGGEIVDPAEVESVVMSHENVGLAAAVGLPDERLGEIGVVFVEAAVGRVVDTEDVLELARSSLARFKVPRYVHVIEEFPKTSTGKIQKHVLRQLAQELADAEH